MLHLNFLRGIFLALLLTHISLQQSIGSPSDGNGGLSSFGSLSQALPFLHNIPGMNFVPGNQANRPERNLDSAIGQFSGPLVRFAIGRQPAPSDIEQLIQSIPNLLVNIPGIGNVVDISKLPPQLIDHVLKGGQLPGVSKETLEAIMKQYMKKMYALAAHAENLHTDIPLTAKDYENAHRFLPPLTKLPQRFVSNVMEGGSLPYLTTEETQVVKNYYVKRLMINAKEYAVGNVTELPIDPKIIQMMKFLPPNYNLSRLPKEVMKQIMNGEMPDFALLPDDILQYIREHVDELYGTLSSMPNITVEEILKKLPKYKRPPQPSFSPYDINKVDSGGIISDKKEDEDKESRMRLLTAILLAFVGAITMVVLALFCYYVKRNRSNTSPFTPSNRGISSDRFQPSSSSTANKTSKLSPSIV